jgi:hypothetical protein
MTDPYPDGDFETQLLAVVSGLRRGRMVPFLGAGVNRCGMGDGPWDPRGPRLPDGKQLSKHLASRLPIPEEPPNLAINLARVSQYAHLSYGSGRLNEELREVFEREDLPVTPVHAFLASLPSRCPKNLDEETRKYLKHFLVVTTNYDDLMEKAFSEAGEKFHVVTYLSKKNKPVFRHHMPDGQVKDIASGTGYDELNHDDYPIILKVHGSVDRRKAAVHNNFVITEDDYLEYLSLGDIAKALPKSLVAQMKQSHFLFLGYGLNDWNMRAFLGRIWRGQNTDRFFSWAVMKEHSKFEELYWGKKDVKIIPTTDLKDYIEELEKYFAENIEKTEV